MIELLSGALAFSYLIGGMHFFKFWRHTSDRLFLHFAIAFWLLTLNQVIASVPTVTDGTGGYEYLLRVLGFFFIIAGILGKNLGRRQP